jgi:hypothetical protein
MIGSAPAVTPGKNVEQPAAIRWYLLLNAISIHRVLCLSV